VEVWSHVSDDRLVGVDVECLILAELGWSVGPLVGQA
jgi:hypothetical protein